MYPNIDPSDPDRNPFGREYRIICCLFGREPDSSGSDFPNLIRVRAAIGFHPATGRLIPMPDSMEAMSGPGGGRGHLPCPAGLAVMGMHVRG